jgi:hypothetical protein
MALQQNEINFFSESPPGYRSVVEPNLVKNGMVIPVHYDPGWNGESIGVPKPVEGLTVQPFHELYRKLKGAPPSGQLWDVYLAMLAINSAMQRLLVLPPTTPQPALDALQAAVARLNSDKAFADDAQKTIGFVPEYGAGGEARNQGVRGRLHQEREQMTRLARSIAVRPRESRDPECVALGSRLRGNERMMMARAKISR